MRARTRLSSFPQPGMISGMAQAGPQASEWERLLQAAERLQSIVPGTILVGGSAEALHAGHRVSIDDDHVLPDLRDRFGEVLGGLESTSGWKTDRIQKPVLILGSLDGVMTGLRQQRRARPLEVEEIRRLRVPTLPEMVRIKGWLLLTRDSTRDLLDAVVLIEKLGEASLAGAFSSFNEIYERGPEGGVPLMELVDRLAAARPADRAAVDLATYKGIQTPWNGWPFLEARSRFWAGRLSALVLGSEP